MIRKSITLALLTALSSSAFALSNTFTYQGSLQDGAAPANGSYDLEFTLQTQAGAPIGSAVLRDDVNVVAGVFTVELNFGASITSADFQLQIGVRPGASAGAFTSLSPATKIAPTPQAQVAGLAVEAVTVSPGAIGTAQINQSQVQARVASSCPAGQSIRVVNANGTVTCESSSSGPVGPQGPVGPAGATGATGANGALDAWGKNGTSAVAGQFIGTTNDLPLEVRVNGSQVAKFIPGSNSRAAVVFGAFTNIASGQASTVAGGGDTASPNSAEGDYSAVSGGNGNKAINGHSTVSGGQSNKAEGQYATVAGGRSNQAIGLSAMVGGGDGNRALGSWSTVAGGDNNIAVGNQSFVAGGKANLAGAENAFAGGLSARVRIAGNPPAILPAGISAADYAGSPNGDRGSFVWVGSSFLENFRSTGPNQFLIRATGGVGLNTTDVADAGLSVGLPSSNVFANKIRLKTQNKTAEWTLFENSGDMFLTAPGTLVLEGGANKGIFGIGSLRWSGTGINSTTSPAFTQVAIFGTNTCDSNTRTVLNHPLLNGNPNAVVLMTPNFGDQNTGVAPPRGATGVYYSNGSGGCTANRWVIYQLAVTPETLNNGVKFNVWFVLP